MGLQEMVRKPLSCVALALLLSGVALPALAATGACTINRAVVTIEMDDLHQEASTAPTVKQILQKMMALGAKATNPHESVGAQLDPSDNEEFEELRAQLLHIQAYNFIQSDRARDARVVSDMFNVALKSYSDASYVPPTDIAKAPGSAVIYLRYMQPNQINYVPSTDTTCTIDFALSQEQAQVLKHVSADVPIVQREKPIIDTMRVKYGIAPGAKFDRSKMSPEDIQTLDLIQNEIKPVMSDMTLALDLSNIRAWWSLAQLTYYDDLQDVQVTDNDSDFGDTLKAQEVSFPPATKAMIVMWNLIDQKVPNDDYTEFKKMQGFIQKATH